MMLGSARLSGRSQWLVAGGLLATFVVAKMIGLEGLRIGSAPFEFKLVTALLPFAMVFGIYGIIGISVGCPLAHLASSYNPFNAGAAFLAASSGSVLSYLIFKRYRGPTGLFLGGLVITVAWTLIFGTYYAGEVGLPLTEGLTSTMSSLWIGVNLVGFLVAEGIRRLADGGGLDG